MSTPNPVEASTSTPDASTAPNPSRGVNEDHQAHSANGTTPKDASAAPSSPGPARRVPAPLLAQPVLWAIALTAGVLWAAPIVYLLLKGHRP